MKRFAQTDDKKGIDMDKALTIALGVLLGLVAHDVIQAVIAFLMVGNTKINFGL